MRIETKHSFALIIDIQERLFPHIHDHEGLARRCEILIKGLQLLEVPMMFTEQYPKGLGPTIPSIAGLMGDMVAAEKMTFSCCGSDMVEGQLLGLSPHSVIVCGIEAHVCVLQTVLDLRAQGRNAVVVADCISSRKPMDRDVAIERMRSAGAIITTYESLLFELCEVAGTDTFKELSKLVK